MPRMETARKGEVAAREAQRMPVWVSRAVQRARSIRVSGGEGRSAG